jgi:diamine N-acetyltransferase
MSITLEDVTSSNYEAVCDLDVTDEQQEYVASNMWSLVESHYCQGHTCKAIWIIAFNLPPHCNRSLPLVAN